MNKIIIAIAFLLLAFRIDAQTTEADIRKLESEILKLADERKFLDARLEGLKLTRIREKLDKVGLPAVAAGDQLIKHAAYYLDFAPEFKQARWVAHIIVPDIIKGVVSRTNDFRIDSAVISGSADETDYFLKKLKPDQTFEYTGFGYDRGHLAPSADFRWSQKALSESYLYSNMSPQLAAFNRGSWGDLEDAVRSYVIRNPTTELFVVTGPFLEKNLPVITQGKNHLPIPARYFKVVADLKNNRGIGFIMPNEAITKPLKTFAVSIDEVEKQTGLNFYGAVPVDVQTKFESQADVKEWLPTENLADVEPLRQEGLSRNHFNTLLARQQSKTNQEVDICGTVVGARTSKAGNILLNIDKQFPNQVFTVFIKKEDIVNFNYNPEIVLQGKIICVKGKVVDLGGTPAMYIQKETDLTIQ